MRAYVGVTDQDWYEFLLARPYLSEVNFWRPSGRGFRAIGTGEPFLFKTHSPSNLLVGGGFLSSANVLRISEAWEFFGEGNGVATITAMRAKIAHYRKEPLGVDEDPYIGCVLLRDVFFVSEERAEPPPPDWAPNLVQGRSYDLSTTNSHLETSLQRLLISHEAETSQGTTSHVPGPMFGDPRLTVPRLGQQAFKALVLTAYDRRCAVTGARIQPTLEAAHIRPVASGGEHRVDNGLLLRSDIHTLFDRGFLGVDPGQHLRVSPRLRSDFGNGEEFYSRAGAPLVIRPSRTADRPSREALEWHMDEVFLSA